MTDVTFVPTDEGWLYLASIIDLYNREVVGWTMGANSYRRALSDRGIEVSMSCKGNCWDNAVAESFFATLKKELVNRHHYETRRQATAIFEYIEAFYNRALRHSELGYSSPIEYRKNQESASVAA